MSLINLPYLRVYVKNEFLFNQEEGHGSFTEAYLIAARVVQAQAMQFIVLLENGVLFTGLPLHAITTKRLNHNFDLSEAQMWDNLSYSATCAEIKFLRNVRCTVKLNSGRIEPGYYLTTIDFTHQGEQNPGLAETPDEWKLMHMVALDCGALVLYPQNRIIFNEASFVVSTNKLPGYKVNTTKWVCEGSSKGLNSDYLYTKDK